jgi:hypothetical protein
VAAGKSGASQLCLSPPCGKKVPLQGEGFPFTSGKGMPLEEKVTSKVGQLDE